MNTASQTHDSFQRKHRAMKIYMLGCVDFDSLLTLQENALQEMRQKQSSQAVLFICEHPPIISVGREGSRAQLAGFYREFQSGQIDVRWLNRGGGAIFHAPGQLAVYSLFPLKQMGIGIHDYQNGLKQAIIDMAADQRVKAQSEPDSAEIFSRCGQFACLGAAIKSWISYYGLYINVSPDLKLLRLIDSNNFDHRLSSLSATLTREASMSSVRESIARHLGLQFGYQDTHFFTKHPLLQKTKKKVYDHS